MKKSRFEVFLQLPLSSVFFVFCKGFQQVYIIEKAIIYLQEVSPPRIVLLFIVLNPGVLSFQLPNPPMDFRALLFSVLPDNMFLRVVLSTLHGERLPVLFLLFIIFNSFILQVCLQLLFSELNRLIFVCTR